MTEGHSIAASDFNATLWRMKRSWQWGLLLRDSARLTGQAVTALAVYGVADGFLALADGLRIGIGLTLVAAFLVIAAKRAISLCLLTDRQMARRADSLLRSPRQTVLGALELARWKPDNDPATEHRSFTRYLIQRSIEEEVHRLRRLTFHDYFPWPEIKQGWKVALVRLLAAAVLLIINPYATKVILGRMLLPWRDIPPYSPYTFTVLPAQPAALYGGTVELTVEISGGAVKSPVTFLSRYQGQVQALACFQESPQRFAQRLERVVNPVEICFTMGKARSRWRRVEVVYQPVITMASVTITPPDYTLMPQRRFLAGTENLSGIRGSRAALALTSNRPLLDGVMTLKSRSGTERNEAVSGVRTGSNTVTFLWTIKEPATLEVVIRDLRGTKNKEPYRLEQKALPDEPPETFITEPAGFALATPETTLILNGYASDDFGLRRVELLQTMVAYRDRIKFLGPDRPERRLDFSAAIDLKAAGVEVGQLLEFYSEALDQNPLMTGATASDIVRVRIISEDEYAAILRARTSLDEFQNRYRLLTDRLNEVKAALRELKATAQSGRASPAELEHQLEHAARVHEETADLFLKTSEDFPIFDSEKDLAKALARLINPLRKNQQQLVFMKPTAPNMVSSLDAMLARLGEQEAALNHENRRAEDIARVARLMEGAAAFKNIVARQTALVRRLNRFEGPSAEKDAARLSALGNNQEEIRVALADFINNLEEAATELPDEYLQLGDDAREFAETIQQLRIDELMQKAVLAAANQDGNQTSRNARHALEKLLELLKSCANSGFGGLCQNQLRFSVNQELKTTLEQMLSAMMMGRSGTGISGIAGGGIVGGDINDGYSVGGASAINVPVFGPARSLSFSDSAAGSGNAKSGASGRGAALLTAEATDKLTVKEKAPDAGESLPPENIPDKYREAIKRYFNPEDISP